MYTANYDLSSLSALSVSASDSNYGLIYDNESVVKTSVIQMETEFISCDKNLKKTKEKLILEAFLIFMALPTLIYIRRKKRKQLLISSVI